MSESLWTPMNIAALNQLLKDAPPVGAYSMGMATHAMAACGVFDRELLREVREAGSVEDAAELIAEWQSMEVKRLVRRHREGSLQ